MSCEKRYEVTNNANWNANATEYLVNGHAFWTTSLKRTRLPKRVLLASTQPFAQEFIDATPYPESAAQWLISLLDLLAGIANWHEDLDHIVVTETEYQRLSAVLDDLVYGVGDDENHPLSAAMTLVGVLIKTYEDQHFPKSLPRTGRRYPR